ncbi:hypothetical protein ACIRSU_28875 [Streptomyces sp. NPDC101160]|uniref:hypothetical protein n=1 Tax=Streptomyces sp. NPDC101160 TaxID=3366118 RepID=UPI003810BDFB
MWRGAVTAHVTAILAQPVFAGVYLSGDYDGLGLHETGANVVTSLCLVQLAVATVLWVRLRRSWPFLVTLALAVAETVQYFAGTGGALWLHIPLGVFTIVAAALLFVAAWARPLVRQETADA